MQRLARRQRHRRIAVSSVLAAAIAFTMLTLAAGCVDGRG
jgi:hypothetical protein